MLVASALPYNNTRGFPRASASLRPRLSQGSTALRQAGPGSQWGPGYSWPAQQQELLATLPIADVWGIGQRWGRYLSAEGIDTALQLRDAPQGWVRRKLSVVGLRTSMEASWLPLSHPELQPLPRKSMVVSRPLGNLVCSLQELQEATPLSAAKAAQKLRRRD